MSIHYVVPEEIVQKVASLIMSKTGHRGLTLSKSQIICDAFAQVQAENPPEITETMRKDAFVHCDGYSHPEFRYMFKVAYLVPEPEVPENIKNLLLTEQSHKNIQPFKDQLNSLIIEAELQGFLRGQKAGSK
jgi:transketolase N-terminal domain/subunit